MTRVKSLVWRRRFVALFVKPLIAYAALELVMYSVCFITRLPRIPDDFATNKAVRLHIFCYVFAVCIHGMFRSIAGNPACNSKFAGWLESTPWRRGMEMPVQPLWLVWEDALLLGVLELFRHFVFGAHFGATLNTFLFSFLVGQVCTFFRARESRLYAALLTFALPAAVFALPYPLQMTGLLAALYLVTLIGQRALFDAFPWPPEKSQSVDAGYYYALLPASSRFEWLPSGWRIMAGLYAGWITVCLLHLYYLIHVPPIDRELLSACVILMLLSIAMVRLCVYVIPYFPPLTVLGRLATGRLQLPRYDCALFAPLLLALGALLPRLLLQYGAPFDFSIAIPIGISVFGAFALPPSYKWWAFCGGHRIRAFQHFSPSVLRKSVHIWHGCKRMSVLLVPWWLALTCAGMILICSSHNLGQQLIVVVHVAIGYAVYRFISTYPINGGHYDEWLRSTPWSAEQPLPLGPPRLVWQDAFALLLTEAAIYRCFPDFPNGFATLIFLITHVLILVPVLSGKQRLVAAALSLGTPLILCFIPGLYGKLAGIVALAALGQIGLRRNLRDLRTHEFSAPLAAVGRVKVFGMNFQEPQQFLRDESFVSISLWIYALYRFFQFGGASDDIRVLGAFVQLILVCVIALRLGKFISAFHPPQNIGWRLRNGLIIPGYDKVFLAPLLIGAFVFFAPKIVCSSGLSIGVAMSLVTLATLMMNRYASPSFRDWQLTGFHSIDLNIDSARHVKRFRSS